MSHHDLPARVLRTQRARPLSGSFAIPGDPAIAVRALLVAAMALGESRIRNLPGADPVAAMARAVQALGARLEHRDGILHLSGLGPGGLLAPEGAIDLGAAADAAALLTGAVGIYPFATRLAGAGAGLVPVLAAMRALGTTAELDAGGVSLKGPRMPLPGRYGAATEAAKSALLLAAIATCGTTTITEAVPTLDHTERMLAAFGARIAIWEEPDGGHSLALEGLSGLSAQDVVIPGDPAAAAFALVAGSVVAGSDIVLPNVLMNPARAVLLPTLMDMGADLRIIAGGRAGGEDVAEIGVRHAALRGTVIPAARTAALRDVLSILVIAAAFAAGDTVIENIDAAGSADGWLAVLQHGLSVNGVASDAAAGNLIIHGRGRITGGGVVPPHPDARLPLSFLVMGMATRDSVTVSDDGFIAARFPGMLDALSGLGATFKRGELA